MMSHLQNKSDIFNEVAKLLYNKNFHPAVAHSAYYSCFQLSKHIWLHKMRKKQDELDVMCSTSKQGSHEVLINQVRNYIGSSPKTDCSNHMRDYYNKIGQLKKLRTRADYDDDSFGSSASGSAITLSDDIISILKKYQ